MAKKVVPVAHLFSLRDLTSSLPVILTTFILLLSVFSLVVPARPSLTTQILHKLSALPNSAQLHLQLAQAYLNSHRSQAWQPELQMVQESLRKKYFSPQVLGTSSDITSQILQIQSQSLKKQKNYEHWEKVVAQYPTYRDAWVQLYYLAYNGGDEQKAAQFKEKIKQLDPNFWLPTLP